MKCDLCHEIAELHEVENHPLRLCTRCRLKLNTHIVVYCQGCDTICWIIKSPKNVMWAAQMSGYLPDYIMDNFIFHQIIKCRCCKDSEVNEFIREARFN